MAKKTLINADMLLATPRRAESNTVAPAVIVETTQPVQQEPVQQVTPSVKEPVVELQQNLPISSVQKGLKIGETRATFIVQEDALEKIKAIAYWDRKNIKEIMTAAMLKYINEYEAKNGAIEPIP